MAPRRTVSRVEDSESPESPQTGVDSWQLARFAAAIQKFVRMFPNNYATVALTHIWNRRAAGEAVDPDEHLMVLSSIVHEMEQQRDHLR
jgi:hypothetical protein